jgi:hypothetical protein
MMNGVKPANMLNLSDVMGAVAAARGEAAALGAGVMAVGVFDELASALDRQMTKSAQAARAATAVAPNAIAPGGSIEAGMGPSRSSSLGILGAYQQSVAAGNLPGD